MIVTLVVVESRFRFSAKQKVSCSHLQDNREITPKLILCDGYYSVALFHFWWLYQFKSILLFI